MLLSIIVPVYNVKDYLIRCLDSICAQTIEDYEVIAVDDGSTDGSSQILDSYCKNNPNFCVYHKKNGGLMSAWKYGLEKANGDYIGFVDSDDYIDKMMYEKLVKAAVECNADIGLCNHYYIDEYSEKCTLHRNPIRGGYYQGEKLTKIRRLMLPLLGDDYISPSRCSKIIRKRLLLECLKYTDNRIISGEDVNSMVPCMFWCKSLVYIDEPLYYYVQRKTSISYVFKEQILDTYTILITNLYRAAVDSGLNEILCTELNNLYNFYGLLWLIYIKNSTLSYKEKKKNFQKLLQKEEYVQALKGVVETQGYMARIYKYTVWTKNIRVFLWGTNLHIFLYKLFKR